MSKFYSGMGTTATIRVLWDPRPPRTKCPNQIDLGISFFGRKLSDEQAPRIEGTQVTLGDVLKFEAGETPK